MVNFIAFKKAERSLGLLHNRLVICKVICYNDVNLLNRQGEV